LCLEICRKRVFVGEDIKVVQSINVIEVMRVGFQFAILSTPLYSIVHEGFDRGPVQPNLTVWWLAPRHCVHA